MLTFIKQLYSGLPALFLSPVGLSKSVQSLKVLSFDSSSSLPICPSNRALWQTTGYSPTEVSAVHDNCDMTIPLIVIYIANETLSTSNMKIKLHDLGLRLTLKREE